MAPKIGPELKIWVFGSCFGHFFSLFPPYFSPKKHKTHKSLDSSLFTKNIRYCFYTQSSSPWFYTLDLEFRGVDVAFQLLSTPLTFQKIFQPLSCSFCLNNMIYCFLQHVSCFICVSSLNLLDFYALCHVSCLDLRPYMLICLDLHVLCYKPCFPMLCSSFCSRLMLELYAHMLVQCCWLCLAWIYVSMCLFPCYMVRSLSSHA